MAKVLLGNIKGPDGKSAYEIAVADGYTGTEAEWLESLKGKDGEGSEADNLPVMYFTGDVSTMTKDDAVVLSVKYVAVDRTIECWAKVSWQGSSSINYPKKNYKIKLYEDEACTTKLYIKPKSSWEKDYLFYLKANWIDVTHARNVINANIVANTVKSCGKLPSELYGVSNLGQVDGFPILVNINGDYTGLYTFNIGNKAKMLGCTDEDKHILFEGSENTNATKFLVNSNPTTNGWDLEFPDDLTTEHTTKLNELLTFVNSSTDAVFAAEIESRFNIPMLIDYMILVQAFNGTDNMGKNQMLASYDGGESWVLQLRDLDTTMGLYWNGSKLYPNTQNLSNFMNNKLLQRVAALYKSKIITRYNELRQGVLSDSNLCNVYRGFVDSVGEGNYVLDQELWSDIPSKDFTDYQQIQQAIIERMSYLDEMYNNSYVFDAGINIDEIADYSVVDISEANYRGLSDDDKSDTTLYAVQPVTESGVVYFLGNKAVDTVKESGSLIYARNFLENTGYRGDYGVHPYGLFGATVANALAASVVTLDDGKAMHVSRNVSSVSCGFYINKSYIPYVAGNSFGVSFDIMGTVDSWRVLGLEQATITVQPSDTSISDTAWKTMVFAGQNTSMNGAFDWYGALDSIENFYLKHLHFAFADVTGLAWTEAPEDVVG